MKHITNDAWEQIVRDAFSPDAPEPEFSEEYRARRDAMERMVTMKESNRKQFRPGLAVASAAALMIAALPVGGMLWMHHQTGMTQPESTGQIEFRPAGAVNGYTFPFAEEIAGKPLEFYETPPLDQPLPIRKTVLDAQGEQDFLAALDAMTWESSVQYTATEEHPIALNGETSFTMYAGNGTPEIFALIFIRDENRVLSSYGDTVTEYPLTPEQYDALWQIVSAGEQAQENVSAAQDLPAEPSPFREVLEQNTLYFGNAPLSEEAKSAFLYILDLADWTEVREVSEEAIPDDHVIIIGIGEPAGVESSENAAAFMYFCKESQKVIWDPAPFGASPSYEYPFSEESFNCIEGLLSAQERESITETESTAESFQTYAFGWLPDGMQADDGFKISDGTGERGITPDLIRLSDNMTFAQLAEEVQNSEGSRMALADAESAEISGNPALWIRHNGQGWDEVWMQFDGTPYVIHLYYHGVTDAEIKRVLGDMQLVPSAEETAGLWEIPERSDTDEMEWFTIGDLLTLEETAAVDGAWRGKTVQTSELAGVPFAEGWHCSAVRSGRIYTGLVMQYTAENSVITVFYTDAPAEEITWTGDPNADCRILELGEFRAVMVTHEIQPEEQDAIAAQIRAAASPQTADGVSG